MDITGINHLTLAVSNIDDSFEFYKEVLGFQPVCKWNKGAYFLVGKDWICLSYEIGAAFHLNNANYTHYAFTVSIEKFPALKAKIIANGVTIFKDNDSPGESLYFLDPDGHKLEIHIGNVYQRIESKKSSLGSWKNVEWFL